MTRESAIADLPGAISKALASLTERVDQIEGKGTLEARMFGNGEDRSRSGIFGQHKIIFIAVQAKDSL